MTDAEDLNAVFDEVRRVERDHRDEEISTEIDRSKRIEYALGTDAQTIRPH